MNIKKHIKILDEYEKKKHRALLRLHLTHEDIIDYCEIFTKLKKKDIDDEMLDNISEIIVHNKTIFDLDEYTIPMDDEVWDNLLAKFKKFRPEPFGNEVIGTANVPYTYETLAGTLDKTHFVFNDERKDSKDERPSLEDFFDNSEIRKNKKLELLVNYKEDGVSMVLELELVNGVYKIGRGISRGKKDHGLGTDVSNVTKGITFKSHILKDTFGFVPNKIGIQMEMLISEDDKTKLEKLLNQTFANRRSAVSALMRRLIFATKKEAKELRKLISLVPVGFELDEDDVSKFSIYQWDEIYQVILAQFIYGSCTMSYRKISGSGKDIKSILAEIRNYADDVISHREDLKHSIDGLVVSICNRELINKLGRKNSINRWQVAYKFPEQVKKTKIIGLIETTGAFGYKEFLAQVEPVVLNGTNQDKGQFHSLNKFYSFNARIGDEVYLKLSGDVIPFVFTDATCKRGDGKKLKLPTHCSTCGSELVTEKNKLRCPNFDCDARKVGRMVTFFTELNSKGIGEATCKNIFDILHIHKPSDILTMSRKDFAKLPKFEEGSIDNAMETLEEIMTEPRKPEAILSSVAIDNFRASTAKKVLDEIGLDNLMDLVGYNKKDTLIDKLKQVKGIDKNATIIAEGLIREYTELCHLFNLIRVKKGKKKDENAQIVLVSGVRNNKELEELSDEYGFIVKESGKKFDILVIKSDEYRTKGKAKLAGELGKPIYTLSEFIKLYK